MHSGNAIPRNTDLFKVFKPHKDYMVEFNRMKTVLLEWPYKTNCRNYDIDSKDHFQTRNDCINECAIEQANIMAGHNQSDQCFPLFLRNAILWRRYLILKKIIISPTPLLPLLGKVINCQNSPTINCARI